ncbi:hypothetical protein BSKO_10115 [Bryopsis sp. KO-2023]|nr:hypothetical protein BSKO_10115 [Bryopsis sp. KO-2023]
MGPESNNIDMEMISQDVPPRWACDSKALRFTGSLANTFQNDCARDIRSVSRFLLSIGQFLEKGAPDWDVPAGLSDFHLKIRNGREADEGWHALMLFGGERKKEGPVSASTCMSCDLTCPLSVGCLGDDTRELGRSVEAAPTSMDTLLSESTHSRCWLDAKARPKIIVTPKRHVRSIFLLSMDEIEDFFQVALMQLRELGFHAFESMILNHGTRQNHAHLHLKVNVAPFCTHKKWWKNGSPPKMAELWLADWMMQIGRVDLSQKLQTLQKFSERLPQHRRGYGPKMRQQR